MKAMARQTDARIHSGLSWHSKRELTMVSNTYFGAFLGLTLAVLSAPALAAPNATAGQAVFKAQCSMCHTVVKGKNGLGPSLAGVLGRKPGSAPAFMYSPPMRAMNAKWDKVTLDRFITDPRTAVPGNRMIFVGQKDAAKRADLIAYLATLK